ncbi:histone acetyltransferase KAT6B, partial [Etheostoma spectabile]|uniref:histone acetyltransferase KAT6B n=1 Tax=Etheostoma spectabile TaxID=54343 RepID=UPI0013AF3F2D
MTNDKLPPLPSGSGACLPTPSHKGSAHTGLYHPPTTPLSPVTPLPQRLSPGPTPAKRRRIGIPHGLPIYPPSHGKALQAPAPPPFVPQWCVIGRFPDQDSTKGFAQTWSKGEETEEGEDEDEGEEEEEEEEEEDNVEEEEDNDTPAETEGRSSSLDDWTGKQTEETQTAKPEELKDASVPEGEQKAAEINEKADSAGGDETDDGTKPANGTADSNSNSQSGANKKLSLFRRLSFSRTKQTSERDQSPAQGAISGDAAVLRGDGEPLSSTETNRSLPSGARGPRSGARGP